MTANPRRTPPLSKAAATLPLQGKLILVSRAQSQASALSFGLRELGAEVLEIPFIEIRPPRSYNPLDNSLQRIRECDWLILTSVNGVDALWQRVQKLGITPAHFRHLKIAAIGPATKKAIEQHGLHVDVVPEQYVAESVVRSLLSKVRGQRVLLVRARVARDVIPRELRKAGAKVDVVEAYETVVPKSSQQKLAKILKEGSRIADVITFTSSSTARNFSLLLQSIRNRSRSQHFAQTRPFAKTKFASIGPVTSATLHELGFRADIEARDYTIPGLIAAIVAASRH